ncbi:MAG: sensor domain-containing diguanylate cyclase [Oscillospiraceae bacterium]|nr:sensor domain-containing diguanylate cyclase [Oscillospiraceae bacterium]
MDYQKYVDGFELTTCIISVERFPDGGYGNIRIVAGNKAYIDSIENPFNGASSHMLNNKFIPGSPYEKYIPKDLNFEQTCFRCAFEKKPVHTYLKPDRFDCWINQYIMPVHSDEPDIGYCCYTLDVTMEADAALMTNVSASTASSVLETCIKLRGSSDFKSAVTEVIANICEYCGAQKCDLLLTDLRQGSCVCIAESVEGRITEIPEGKYDNARFFDIVKTWGDTIAGSNCLILKDPRELEILKERNPVWYESLRTAGVDSIVLFPLVRNAETVGYIWATNFDPSRAQKIKDTLELTTYFIAAEIANFQLFRRLEAMSTVDMLTGIMNRNAMNKKVDALTSGEEKAPERYAVIFADLNGLKRTNDINGHSAGDKLLKDGAARLKERFPESDIFRAGGDEFVVISDRISEAEMEKRMQDVRKDSEDGNISFAIGGFYSEKGEDIRLAMRIADERMYADKKAYYEKFPERARE